MWQRFTEFGGRPFSDLGPKRIVEWKQLGIHWKVQWKNNYATTARAEQFVAVLQILLCKAAGRDLCLLETIVEIDFSIADIVAPKLASADSNDLRRWQLVWPMGVLVGSGATAASAMQDALQSAMTVLLEVSLLPDDAFRGTAKKLFKEGLSSAIYAAKPYETLYRAFFTEETFNQTDRASLEPPRLDIPFVPRECQELRNVEGPAPGYSKQSALEAVSNRYTRIPPLIKYTLQRLNEDAVFRQAVKRLRADGWLDWHLLLAIYNIAINYRARTVADARWPHISDWKQAMRRFSESPEQEEWEPIPPLEFSYDSLKTALRMSLGSTVTNEGLQMRHRTPLLEAIFKFMRKRYGYWTDDMPHEQIFAE